MRYYIFQPYRKLRRIAEKLAECALNGEPWAISQVIGIDDSEINGPVRSLSGPGTAGSL